MVADGSAPKIDQDESGATYEALLKKELVELKFDKSAQEIHNFIRGCDHNPGAWTTVNGQVRFVWSRCKGSNSLSWYCLSNSHDPAAFRRWTLSNQSFYANMKDLFIHNIRDQSGNNLE